MRGDCKRQLRLRPAVGERHGEGPHISFIAATAVTVGDDVVRMQDAASLRRRRSLTVDQITKGLDQEEGDRRFKDFERTLRRAAVDSVLSSSSEASPWTCVESELRKFITPEERSEANGRYAFIQRGSTKRYTDNKTPTLDFELTSGCGGGGGDNGGGTGLGQWLGWVSDGGVVQSSVRYVRSIDCASLRFLIPATGNVAIQVLVGIHVVSASFTRQVLCSGGGPTVSSWGVQDIHNTANDVLSKYFTINIFCVCSLRSCTRRST
ncbi:unnamed protein product [Ectocarpus sp. 4 AP-2014]